MAYVQNVPQATQQINTSQPIINANFVGLYTTWGVNHSPLLGTGVSPDGKHIKVDLTQIGAEPTAAGDDLTLYNFLNAATGQSEMYVCRNGSTGKPFTAAAFATATNGWTYLPSGLLVKWGASNKTGEGTVTINWGPDYDGTTQPVAFVFTKWVSTAVDAYARFYTISNVAQPVLTVKCSLASNPATAAEAYFNFIVIGVGA